jgi:hypothetical protein
MSLQLEYLRRIHRQDAVRTRQGEMVNNIERVDWLPALVDRLAGSLVVVQERFPDSAAAINARRIVEDCSSELNHLELGHLWFDYEDISMLLDQAVQARESIRSTSLQTVDLEWWLSPLGRKYWQAMLDALNRGVHVERIFIYSEWTTELAALAAQQHEAGVHVLKVHRSDLPARLRIDVIIWDNRCGYETRLNDRGEGQRNFFTLRREEISRMITMYDTIFSSAEDLDGESKRCKLH